LYSEHLLNYRRGKIDSFDFDEIVKSNFVLYNSNKPSSLNKGLYYDSICYWVKIFGKENVKVVFFDEFKKNQQEMMSSIFNWLCLSDTKINNLKPQKTGDIRFKKTFYFINNLNFINIILKFLFKKKNRVKIRSFIHNFFIRKRKKNDISDQTLLKLMNFYKQDIRNLENLLNRDLSKWINYKNN
jgi:hypothetical protein